MDPQRTPSGEIDSGDDAYGDSIIEAARYILDDCVKLTHKGGKVRGFSEFFSILMTIKHGQVSQCHVNYCTL